MSPTTESSRRNQMAQARHGRAAILRPVGSETMSLRSGNFHFEEAAQMPQIVVPRGPFVIYQTRRSLGHVERVDAGQNLVDRRAIDVDDVGQEACSRLHAGRVRERDPRYAKRSAETNAVDSGRHGQIEVVIDLQIVYGVL